MIRFLSLLLAAALLALNVASVRAAIPAPIMVAGDCVCASDCGGCPDMGMLRDGTCQRLCMATLPRAPAIVARARVTAPANRHATPALVSHTVGVDPPPPRAA